MNETPDYLVLGSGLSALAFSALAAQQGKRVKVLEAHEHLGGYGHTFAVGDYRFNAQFHYVTSCGEGSVVNTLLKRLGLEKKVAFRELNREGYDHVYCGDKKLWIPHTLENLEKNLLALAPEASPSIKKFIAILIAYREAVASVPGSLRELPTALKALPHFGVMLKYHSSTLQEVFDACQLPKIVQTLIAGQMINYMLPPKDLSFFAFALLFNGYSKGAYYPEKHYEHVINSLVEVIQNNGGTFHPNTQVVSFIREGKTIKGVHTQSVDPKTGVFFGPVKACYGKTIICNFDPKQAAKMIGLDNFSYKVRRALDYDYSWSSFVLYGAVKGINLRDYGFGDWNIWHCQEDLNKSIEAMYYEQDYSKPYFAMNCPSYFSPDQTHCLKEDSLKFELLTVGNYEYWKELKLRDHRYYYKKKQEVLDTLLDVVEEHYVPNIRKHLTLKMIGSPTSSKRFVWAPKGGCYGVNLTPRNFAFTRKLTAKTSLKNFYFCSAASGYAGFAGTIYTGMNLFDKLINAMGE